MSYFYSGSATTMHGSNKHTGRLVFTDSYCDFSSAKYNFREDFDDICRLSTDLTSISVPSIFGAKKRDGIVVYYNSSCIGEFVLEEGNASDVVSKVMTYVRSEKARAEQAEHNRRAAEAQKAEEEKEALRQHDEMQKKLKELEEQLNSFPAEIQNTPRVLEIRQQYDQ